MLHDSKARRSKRQETCRSSGCFVLVIGPSGAGKDTLLAGARSRLAGEPCFHFVRRTITRPASLSEDNDHLTEAEFRRAADEGRFVLTWSAHGLQYGVPASAREGVRNGQIVVCNGSRGAIRTALARFSCLRIVLVTAPREVRLQRLTARGREADVGSRLDRAINDEIGQYANQVIDNSGTIEDGVAALVGFLQSLACPAGTTN